MSVHVVGRVRDTFLGYNPAGRLEPDQGLHTEMDDNYLAHWNIKHTRLSFSEYAWNNHSLDLYYSEIASTTTYNRMDKSELLTRSKFVVLGPLAGTKRLVVL